MNRRASTLFHSTLLTFLCILAVACTKKRADINAQGQNLAELTSMTELHNKSCQLTTAPTPRDASQQTSPYTNAVEKPVVGKNSHHIRFFDIVDVAKTDCPYVMENQQVLEFRGKPSTTYNMIYRVSATHLTLYKIVSDDEVSHYELSYGTKYQDNYYVPVGGFAIEGFFNKEKQKNADNRNTNVKVKVPVASDKYATAGFLSFDKTKFQKFATVHKKDVFPRGFFDGEWYYNRTLVQTNRDSNSTVGTLMAADASYRASARVKFIVKESQLLAVNLNIDEKLVKEYDDLNYSVAVSIPAEPKDYRRKLVGDTLDFAEEQIETAKADQRKFLALDLKEIKTVSYSSSLLSSIFSAISEISKGRILKQLEVEEDYFSFQVEDNSTRELFRYSFKRVPTKSQYQPRTYHREDWKRFGYFTVAQDRIYDHRTVRREDRDKLYKITRFNLDKPITFRFSRQTPGGPENEWMRDIARDSIAVWQQAFEMASGENRTFIQIQETCSDPHPEFGCDVELGDIRYNVINYIDVYQGSTLGFGPSLHDPLTGEIVTATMNLMMYSLRESAYAMARGHIAKNIGYRTHFRAAKKEYPQDAQLSQLLTSLDMGLIKKEGDKYEPSSFYQWKDPATQQEVVFEPVIAPGTFGSNSSKNSTGVDLSQFPDFDSFAKTVLPRRNAVGQDLMPESLLSHLDNSGYDSLAIDRLIEAKCPTVAAFIEKYRSARSLPSTETENKAIEPCVRHLVVAYGLYTTVHEVGHNLGLRHNFESSYDKANFIPSKTFKLKHTGFDMNFAETYMGSIMEYIPTDKGFHVTPGGYDIAAIRYSYFGKVELEGGAKPGSGKLISVAPNQSAVAAAQSLGSKPRNFRYCTDADIWYRTSSECVQWDTGTTKTELAKETIQRVYDNLDKWTYRYDRLYAGELSMFQTFYSLHMIYEDWRRLVADEVGESKRYLPGIRVEEYEGIVERVLARHGEKARDLLRARNLITHFLVDLALTPNRYCIVEQADYGKFYYEFSNVLKQLKNLSVGGTVVNCSDPEAKKLLERRGLKVHGEIGHPVYGGNFQLDGRNLYDGLDFGGTAQVRVNAAYFLFRRLYSSYLSTTDHFGTTFLDEPDLRAALAKVVEARIKEGVLIPKEGFSSSRFAHTNLIQPDDFYTRFELPERHLNFSEETYLVQFIYEELLLGLWVPNDDSETVRRRKHYSTILTSVPTNYDDTKADSLHLHSDQTVVTLEPDSFAQEMMEKMREIDALTDLSTGTPLELEQIIEDELTKYEEFGKETYTVKQVFDRFARVEMNYFKAVGGEVVPAKQVLDFYTTLVESAISEFVGETRTGYLVSVFHKLKMIKDEKDIVPDIVKLLNRSFDKAELKKFLQKAAKIAAEEHEIYKRPTGDELKAQQYIYKNITGDELAAQKNMLKRLLERSSYY